MCMCICICMHAHTHVQTSKYMRVYTPVCILPFIIIFTCNIMLQIKYSINYYIEYKINK